MTPTSTQPPIEEAKLTKHALLFILHVLRNPHGYSDAVARAVRLEAAQRLELIARAVE